MSGKGPESIDAMLGRPDKRGHEPLEKPGLVITYLVGSSPIVKGEMVGVDAAGLLVPILEAEAFVGITNDAHAGSDPGRRGTVSVTVTGTFVFGFVGWAPSQRDMDRKVWAFDGRTLAPAPLRSSIEVGRVVGVETCSDGRPGFRIKIDEAVGRAQGWSDEQVAGVWEWYLDGGAGEP